MYDIYQYGMQMALELGFSFITSVVLCCIWGKIVEGIIFFAIFIPLRSYLGGFHMKSYRSCYICSCVTLVTVLGLSSFKPDYYTSWIILSISIIIIFFEAKGEKLRDEEGIHFYYKICIIILVILIIGIIFTVWRFSSGLFLLTCTNKLVAVSKLLENTQEIKEPI